MLGALKRSSLLLICVVLLPSSIIVPRSGASELGNILFPSVAARSRSASAAALDAISLAITAFSLRERQKNSDSAALLRKSSAQLLAATADMQALLEISKSDPGFSKFLDEPFSRERISKRDQAFFEFWLKKNGVDVPKSRRDIFNAFIKNSNQLANIIRENSEKQNDELYSLISYEISIYLRAGDVVTHVMRG